jgi:glycosyltransferase involved in cell wall biosynthesis
MTDRIRVLTVIDSLGVGGAESLLPTFVRHVDHERFDVRVLALRTAPPNHVQEQVRAFATSLEQWPATRLFDRSRVRQLAAKLHADAIDVVHSHLLYSNIQAARAGRIAGIPTIASLHSQYPSRHRMRSLPKRTVEIAILRSHRTRAIAVGERVREAYGGPFGLSGEQVVVIPNAVDLDRFLNQPRDAAQATRAAVLADAPGPLVVAVGRMAPPKGFPDLVKAARIVHQTLPGVRFAIAGRAGSDAENVHAEITRQGMEDVVSLLGQRDDVPLLLAGADLYVMSSLWEGAPVALLEAMAAGAPVVATRVGDVPDVITDGVNGLLADAGDPAGLAAAIVRALRDPAAARSRAERGLETVRGYDAVTWVRRIEAEYERAVERTRSRVAKREVVTA